MEQKIDKFILKEIKEYEKAEDEGLPLEVLQELRSIKETYKQLKKKFISVKEQ